MEIIEKGGNSHAGKDTERRPEDALYPPGHKGSIFKAPGRKGISQNYSHWDLQACGNQPGNLLSPLLWYCRCAGWSSKRNPERNHQRHRPCLLPCKSLRELLLSFLWQAAQQRPISGAFSRRHHLRTNHRKNGGNDKRRLCDLADVTQSPYLWRSRSHFLFPDERLSVHQ